MTGSNWGRWGDDDERGAANLLEPDVVLAGVRTPTRGTVYPLGQQVRPNGAPILAGRPPIQQFLSLDGGDFAAGTVLPGFPPGYGFADDTLIVTPHGTTTHVDALCHLWVDGQMYNGHSSDAVHSYGATRCGIEKLGAIVTRGVLLDVPGFLGLDRLAPSHAVSIEELEGCAEHQGIEVRAGDVVLVRTGWPQVWAEHRDPVEYSTNQPGVGRAAAEHLADLDIVALGCDNSSIEPFTVPTHLDTHLIEGAIADGVHLPLLRERGVYLIEMLDLEEIARDRVYEFLFVLAPLLVRGGTGSPVNPLAIA